MKNLKILTLSLCLFLSQSCNGSEEQPKITKMGNFNRVGQVMIEHQYKSKTVYHSVFPNGIDQIETRYSNGEREKEEVQVDKNLIKEYIKFLSNPDAYNQESK